MTKKENEFNVIFVVCHPDDEAIWIGGLLSELSKFEMFKCSVICLSGADPSSPREKEFFKAKDIAGYEKGIVLERPLRAALESLPPIGSLVDEGLSKLNITTHEITLLITHSPYGDERMHPHHQQAYRELFKWSGQKKVPFGYFSCVPVPFVSYRSLLKHPLRKGTLHILNFAKCRKIMDPRFWLQWKTPAYYLQFFSESRIKVEMLECYKSINVDQHLRGYASSTNLCESLYLLDRRGIAPFEILMRFMAQENTPFLFNRLNIFTRIKTKMNTFFFKKERV